MKNAPYNTCLPNRRIAALRRCGGLHPWQTFASCLTRVASTEGHSRSCSRSRAASGFVAGATSEPDAVRALKRVRSPISSHGSKPIRRCVASGRGPHSCRERGRDVPANAVTTVDVSKTGETTVAGRLDLGHFSAGVCTVVAEAVSTHRSARRGPLRAKINQQARISRRWFADLNVLLGSACSIQPFRCENRRPRVPQMRMSSRNRYSLNRLETASLLRACQQALQATHPQASRWRNCLARLRIVAARVAIRYPRFASSITPASGVTPTRCKKPLARLAVARSRPSLCFWAHATHRQTSRFRREILLGAHDGSPLVQPRSQS